MDSRAFVSAWFLACLVVLAVQTVELQRRRSEHAAKAAQALEKPTPIQSSASSHELERLRKDAAEAKQLRAEVAALEAKLAEAEALKAERKRLLDIAVQRELQSAPKTHEDFFASTLEKSQRTLCVNHLKQLALAARIWANRGNLDQLPDNFEVLKADAQNEKIFRCPSADSGSYELLSPGAPENDPQVVFAWCSKHRNAALVDGSVQRLPDESEIYQKEGKYYTRRIP